MATSTPDPNLTHFRIWRVFRCRRTSATDRCSICLDTYDSNHIPVRVRFKGCMHRFGQACLYSWLLSGSPMSNCCPICRKLWYTRANDARQEENSRNPASLRDHVLKIRLRLAHRLLGQQHGYAPIDGSESVESEGGYLTAIELRLTVLEATGLENYGLPPDTHDRLEGLEVRLRALRHRIYGQPHDSTTGFSPQPMETERIEILNSIAEVDTPRCLRRQNNRCDNTTATDSTEALHIHYENVSEVYEQDVHSSPHPAAAVPTAPSNFSGSSRATVLVLEPTDEHPLSNNMPD
ncbi:hypothetical protein BDU57DRAFT_176008 [Ampelomyces quisqualis]|uniref:RING-type domain-containing protein n=1 Tax=Ampelomyces quisqualis TaxID=50730 RepID=A0A6A5QQS7_AMPQU|nr:hypothetical protein BDU57DRAFT_176008 [Ampelomyces quisqualis]